MAAENWIFVDGFTQPSGDWPFDQPGAPRGWTSGSVPLAASFVEAAGQLRWMTTYRERAQPVEHTAFVGYSMGGRLCLQLALDHPEVVERLALISGSPGIADPNERAERRKTDERLATGIERDGVDAFLERWIAQPLFASLPRERAGLADRRARNTVDSLTYQLRVLGQGAQPSNWERLGELRVPVLLIAGELDAKYVGIAQRMAAAIPQARVEIVADAGHACHLERPDVVAHLLSSW